MIRRGDIWLVNLDPTIGHEIKKLRPAVVIQNDIGNQYSPLTIVAPITSQRIEIIFPIEVLLTPRNSQLPKTSKALLNQIRAVDKKRLIKRLGKLNDEALAQMDEAIKVSLGVND